MALTLTLLLLAANSLVGGVLYTGGLCFQTAVLKLAGRTTYWCYDGTSAADCQIYLPSVQRSPST